MAQLPPPVVAAWRDPSFSCRFETAVSLHGHTYYSREILDFIPRLADNMPLLGGLIQRELERYRRTHGGAELDWRSAWWTPPLSPQQAWDVETRQIGKLHLRPLVSLTDHDNVDAPLLLRAAHPALDVPVSVEWTVPFEGTFFHLGIHDLPWGHARDWMARFAAFTARPEAKELGGILADLAALPHVLTVFNHPLWDEKGIGEGRHREAALAFLERFGRWIHALEINGLRNWSENRRVVALAAQARLPLVAGGDRHTSEPNACLNLTNAATFGEFVAEIREERRSQVLLMPHYREPMTLRILENIRDVLKHRPEHALGWERWSDRVFYLKNGQPVAVGEAWGPGEPWIVTAFVHGVGWLDGPAARGFCRWLFPVNELT